jgi:tetratricopeptide (TPR) repeat protein
MGRKGGDLARRGLACGLVAFSACAAMAWADDDARERNKGARTIVGAPYSVQCAAYAAEGRADAVAVQACTQALDMERLNRANKIATLINRGALNLRSKDGAAALADFAAVVALDKKNAEAHLNRGAALVMVGQPGPAVAAITHALSLGVREPHKAYFNRGAAREAMSNLRGAYEDYETALQIQPDWGPAQAELQRFVRMKRDTLALKLNSAAESENGTEQQ